MKAIFVSFEGGQSRSLTARICRHVEDMQRYPDLVLSMALQDGSRHGVLHIFASSDAAERFLLGERFRALSTLPPAHAVFVRRFDVVAQARPAGQAGPPVPSQALAICEATRTGSSEREPAHATP